MSQKKPPDEMTYKSLVQYFRNTVSGKNWVFPINTQGYTKIIKTSKRLKGIELWRNAAAFS